MGDGVDIVGHSYGGLGAMIAAARRPDMTLSLTLLEPAAGSLALDDPDWQGLVAEVRALWDRDLSDHDWVVAFLEAVGSDPGSLPDELIDAAVELLPTFRNGRPFHTAQLPIDELAAAAFPKLVVSGGHGPGFEAMCDDLARKIGAARTVLPGAGHEVQFVGQPLNDKLTELWSGQPASSANDGRTGRGDAQSVAPVQWLDRGSSGLVGRGLGGRARAARLCSRSGTDRGHSRRSRHRRAEHPSREETGLLPTSG